ncbi:MAG TPA: DUF2332 domain-containing protein [Trebonia sp.]
MSMPGDDLTAERYLGFAAEARGRSPQYEELATVVAGDSLALGFLRSLPAAKRQPNLLFAAATYLLGESPELAALRRLVGDRAGELTAVMLARRTQTNEAARCATLLPALAQLPQPLALIEIGASAGLTLIPDRYSYDYGDRQVTGTDPDAPVLSCRTLGPVPVPAQVPDVAWRAGLDLNPLDVTADDDVRWLECLLWPGEAGRPERLAAAIETARRDPPRIHRGDLLTDLPAVARDAPPHATLVIYHSAVLAYVAAEQRRQVAETIRALNASWLSNEGPDVIPAIAFPERDGEKFVLVRDGTRALAFTDAHGAWIDWLP